jgi:phosphoglycerate dehydrogenase-like enzyme
MTFGPLIDDQFLRDMPKLKWIQGMGSGVDGLVDRVTLRSEIIVTRVHGIVAPVSEAVLGAMLALSRDMPRSTRNQSERRWERYPSTLLHGKTVGILGVGSIAAELAPKCKAFGMRVIGLSSVPRPVDGFDDVVPIGSLTDVAAQLDYLVVLTPYSEKTRDMINEEVLSSMKPSAFFLNYARGGVVEESALISALRQRRIAGAALDVFQTVPLPDNHDFWSVPNLIVTPHIGGLCDVYPQLALPTVEHNMACFLAGNVGAMKDLVKS